MDMISKMYVSSSYNISPLNIFFGVMIGIFISITPAVLLDLFGLDKLPNTLGSNFLVIGIGYLLGGPVMRKFIDFISVHVIGHLTCPLSQSNGQSMWLSTVSMVMGSGLDPKLLACKKILSWLVFFICDI